jgi:hypothetical protein
MVRFEEVFMPFMLTNDGRRLIERVEELLPKPHNGEDHSSTESIMYAALSMTHRRR